ncbi:MAG TPA: hypothetical protein VMU61_05410 [Candidatus Aquilonibacter sp.]|nr:hypothetical protein [Candidatus Aquilonibacter sp.]
MYSWENPDDRVAIVQMNSELRHAQLELLSAHCATHQLRLRFSSDDLARFGQRDILRKAVQAASALNEYYSSIEKKIPRDEAGPEPFSRLTDKQIADAVQRVSVYLQEQREHYLPAAVPLGLRQRSVMAPYFSAGLLDQIRIVELHGEPMPNPPFYAEAVSLGFLNLPQIAHMSSLTFLDVVVFNESMTERALFHALVHAVQFQILGLERYTDLFVRSFVDTKFHFSVPLEAHAFSLESRFVAGPADCFSVEDQVRIWVRNGRY